MKKIVIAIILILLLSGLLILINNNKQEDLVKQEEPVNSTDNEKIEDNQEEEITPLSKHGKLHVEGTKIIDKNGQTVQLKGISSHGIYWYPEYISKDTFKFLRDEWGINIVRIAMYTEPNAGYTDELHKKVKEGVNYATELGLYVIVDWHILSDGNPNTHKTEAISFFKEMANEYKNNENIIYEICNEPNGNVSWERDIKPYAEDVIKQIREIDDDAIIICGTPNWSQDVDIVSKSKIEGYDNIMYALHFYAATHTEWLRIRVQKALDEGLPIFVSEFGICDASGNGAINYTQADLWLEFLNNNDISWVMWNLSNKQETSALISSSCNKLTGWIEEELSESGIWLVEALKE